VPRFEPFTGVRYDLDRVAVQDVVAPPYDVIGPEEQRQLEERSPYNVVRVELPRDEPDRDRYDAARCRFDEWLASGVLRPDAETGFYMYAMGHHDDAGRPRQTMGVIGALGLSGTGDGDVLPHERTMPKARDDRLDLLRSCRANLSPIWGLSLASGLSDLCRPDGPPLARCTDADGVHHRLWRMSGPGAIEAVTSTVASAPVVIADGHHRYETALAYRDERRAASGGAPGPHDLIMALLVELADDQLSVAPIHRLVTDLPDGFDPLPTLAAAFDLTDGVVPGPDLPDRARHAGALALVTRGNRAWLARPRPGHADPDLTDAGLLDEVLSGWPPHATSYPHRADDVLAAVGDGRAQLGLLLRPPTVAQIAATARTGRRMPQKTTFFQPKPRSGMVFRRLDE
jgi:uncharacterized protein (DUF1015 family)